MMTCNRLILLFFPIMLFSQTNPFEKEIFIVENDTLRYRILAPVDYDENERYPVHLFLHGSGERGNDNELQLFHGSDLFLNVNNRTKKQISRTSKNNYLSNRNIYFVPKQNKIK